MNELEIRELFAREKQEIEQKIQEHERREKLRRIAEHNCEWRHFISEERQDYIINSCIEICDILEKTIISTFCELWERLKEWFSAIADQFSESTPDFAKLVEEIQAAINVVDDKEKERRFFGNRRRKTVKIMNFKTPEKVKFRKWRYSVYGNHG